MIKEEVDSEEIADVISKWTEVPVGKCWRVKNLNKIKEERELVKMKL